MRSKFYLATLAAITLAACSNDDLVTKPVQNDNPKIIEFRASVAKTRAEEQNIESLKKNGFWVRAVKSNGDYLWNDWEKTGGGGTNMTGILKFVYDSDRDVFVAEIPSGAQFDLKWPEEEVSFYALNVAPETTYQFNNGDGTYSEGIKTLFNSDSKTGYNYMNFTPETSISDQVDFMYATNKGTSDDFGSTAIPLTFKHPLVQVEVQAVCTSTYYDVLVKGYKIHYLSPDSYDGFIFPKPVTYDSQVAAHNTAEQPSGQWTWIPDVSKPSLGSDFNFSFMESEDVDEFDFHSITYGNTDYISELYGGYTSYDLSNSATKSTKVPTTKPWITLSATPQKILGDANTNANAMMVPAPYVVDGYNDGACKGKDVGAYIALLVQVNHKNGTALFPGVDATTNNRICYRNVPKFFGYVYVPITIDWRESAGKKVVYTLDLSYGFGRLDPTHTETVDPNYYNPENDLLPGTGGVDPYTPDQELIQHDMLIKAKTEDWDNSGSNSVIM